MKGSLSNEKDIKDVNSASEGGGGNNYISIKNGKNFIRILSKDFISEFVHVIKKDKKFLSAVCLGGMKGKGYAPDICPICAKGKKIWDKIKEMKSDSDFEHDKEAKMLAEDLKKKGKELQTKLQTKMIAVYGEAVKEKVKGKIKLTPEWESEAKILNVTEAQWRKLTKEIFENYKFMKSSNDLLTHNLIFEKLDKKSKDGKSSGFTEVDITPCETVSKAPAIENEIPDLEKVFAYNDADEIKTKMKEFFSNDEEENEEESDDTEEVDDDIDEIDEEDDDEEEEKPKKKNKKSKKDEDEGEEF